MKKLIYLSCLLLITLTTKGQLPNYVDTSGLVGWWSFSGNANDSSGKGNNGTVYGATLTTDRFGNPNSAYSFNGTSDYIQIPNNSSLDLENDNSYTISTWVEIPDYSYNQDANAPQRCMIGMPNFPTSNGLAFRSVDIDYFLDEYTFAINNNVVNYVYGDDTLSLNIWTNLVVTYNYDTVRLYKNGVEMGDTVLGPVSLYQSTQPLFFGKEFNVTDMTARWFKGNLDDIGIWDRSLTSQEVQKLYSGGSSTCLYYDTILVSTVDTLIIDVSTGIAPPNNIDTLKVYPNPTHDHVEINTGNYSEVTGYTIKIVNTLAQTVFQSAITQQIFNISLSGWAKGVYQIEIFNSQSMLVETKELVLE